LITQPIEQDASAPGKTYLFMKSPLRRRDKSYEQTHESTEDEPNEILVLPAGSESGDLQEKDAIVLQKVIDLGQELRVAADTNVLKR